MSAKLTFDMVKTVLQNNLQQIIHWNNHPESTIIEYVSNDSRCNELSGGIFVAIRGEGTDGHRYIPMAIEQGAAAVVAEVLPEKLNPEIVYFLVQDSYAAYALLMAAFYDYPARNMDLYAVTGTNGKTTSAYIWRELLQQCHKHCGLISTVSYDCGNGVKTADRTTPDAGRLQKMFETMVDCGLDTAVMEVSSHALAQRRIGTLKFKTAIFTNLTGDHLDYHKTMENYYQTKKRLFSDYMDSEGIGVINIDDAYGYRLAQENDLSCRIITFGRHAQSEWQMTIDNLDIDGSDFSLIHAGNIYQFHCALIGEHNVYNLCGVIVAALNNGIKLEVIQNAVPQIPVVPGRLERIKSPQGVLFFVDYAHTDDALDNVLKILRRVVGNGRLISLFGCGGNRDKTKRPRMGKAASQSDIVIVTSDNPRNENPQDIIADILPGIIPGTDYHVEPDRLTALKMAFELSRPGDVVLVAGKGHEDYQEINNVKHHFSDAQAIRSMF